MDVKQEGAWPCSIRPLFHVRTVLSAVQYGRKPYIKSIIYSAIRHSAAEVLPTFVIRPALRKLWSK